jgi:hypothetical protein
MANSRHNPHFAHLQPNITYGSVPECLELWSGWRSLQEPGVLSPGAGVEASVVGLRVVYIMQEGIELCRSECGIVAE